MLFATAEFDPIVKVGGLGEAAAGLVRTLRKLGVDVEVVMPDYGNLAVRTVGDSIRLDVPEWVGGATTRRAVACGNNAEITLISLPGIERSHPYGDPDTGRGYGDNDRRFLGFSAAVAALADLRKPDVLHVNDWHTAAVPAFLRSPIPTVLNIHNAAHQGLCDSGWRDALGDRGDAYLHGGACNPLAGGIALADRIVAVSPTYADEIRSHLSAGLEDHLRSRNGAVLGIRNGIDLDKWSPATNAHLPEPYDVGDLQGKELCRKELVRQTTLADDGTPVIAMVARLTHQKGVDLALDLAAYLPTIGARLILMGEGEADLVARAARVASTLPDRVHFFARYRERLANLVIAGSDLFLAPSRFEPCGLTQMHAMTCGTLPIVTAVGGLRDTVIDADRDPADGCGFVAATPTAVDLVDAVHRAVRAANDRARFAHLQKRAMGLDWSWESSARRYIGVYHDIIGASSPADEIEGFGQPEVRARRVGHRRLTRLVPTC